MIALPLTSVILGNVFGSSGRPILPADTWMLRRALGSGRPPSLTVTIALTTSPTPKLTALNSSRFCSFSGVYLLTRNLRTPTIGAPVGGKSLDQPSGNSVAISVYSPPGSSAGNANVPQDTPRSVRPVSVAFGSD